MVTNVYRGVIIRKLQYLVCTCGV